MFPDPTPFYALHAVLAGVVISDFTSDEADLSEMCHGARRTLSGSRRHLPRVQVFLEAHEHLADLRHAP